ncbi:manganese-binding transcriptional regulator MntR [Acetobacteraceae bacterium KSS8]|uniref:Transcriptional regulator MntR n=1 Tax=Endosaccharibacter trunci TaxID=2812733 RepID=A0ABT1W5Z9_9PROT|nr:manganese-binding transcriptional regulator MntR [Acetobacteraceae bacterium KSS8]
MSRPPPPDPTNAAPEPGGLAAHLDRARGAQMRVLLEDYVELIDDLAGTTPDRAPIGPTVLARHLGVSHATVIKCIARLCREGLASSEPYRGVVLTASGTALADKVRRRHRLVVALLRAVGVPDADAEADAEGIEHHVSDRTLAAFERFLEKTKGSAL